MIHPDDPITTEEREAAIIGGLDPRVVDDEWNRFRCYWPSGTAPRSKWGYWWTGAKSRIATARMREDRISDEMAARAKASRVERAEASSSPPQVSHRPDGLSHEERARQWARQAAPAAVAQEQMRKVLAGLAAGPLGSAPPPRPREAPTQALRPGISPAPLTEAELEERRAAQLRGAREFAA